MRDGFRRLLPFAISLSLIGGLGATHVVAQDEAAPAVGISATTVNGLKAIESTGNKNRRRGKLMAFNSAGYLPTNVVKGVAATLTQLGDTTGAVNEADNPVQWNQIQGVPAAVVKGDATSSTIVFETPPVAPGAQGVIVVAFPVGIDVETTYIPTAAGAAFYVASTTGGSGYAVTRSADLASLIELHTFQNIGAVQSTVRLRATVWNDTYLSPSAVSERVKVTYFKNKKKALEAIGVRQ